MVAIANGTYIESFTVTGSVELVGPCPASVLMQAPADTKRS